MIPPIIWNIYTKRICTPKETNEAKAENNFLLPVKSREDLFKNMKQGDIAIPNSAFKYSHHNLMPLGELLAVAAICKHKQPSRVFEIGTYTGICTLVIAANTSDNSEIVTLDLDPSQRSTHRHGTGIGGFEDFVVGEVYRRSTLARKITQLFGDSRTLDFSPYLGAYDLVLIDADHSYEFVKSDTEVAFKLLSPGGTIIWDDYVWNEPYPECGGVSKLLHELQGEKCIYQIANTRLAIYLD